MYRAKHVGQAVIGFCHTLSVAGVLTSLHIWLAVIASSCTLHLFFLDLPILEVKESREDWIPNKAILASAIWFCLPADKEAATLTPALVAATILAVCCRLDFSCNLSVSNALAQLENPSLTKAFRDSWLLLVAETSQNLRAVGYAKKFHFVTSLIILPFLHSSSLLLSVSLVLTDWTLLEAPVELVDIEASLYFGFLNWSVLLALSPLLKANVHAVSVAAEA